jgi:RNA polymerase sigma-70 factor (ECF subfamily)
MPERNPSVAQWLPAARAGSAEALGQLLEAYRNYLLWIATRQLDPDLKAKGGASDLVQETFLKAQQHFNQFQGEGEGDLKAWLRQLLLNNVADFTRMYQETAKRRVGREAPLAADSTGPDLAGRIAADTPSPSGQAIQKEQFRAIQEALARLPEEYRQVIVYRYQEERSFEEIGRLMNLTPNAARKLWVRAIKRLQQESAGPP